ncbi:MAG: DUF3450 domain-containing protein [Bdellovibrionaceae bacterium]|nr:DUF3450 domain-containing protein [Pseudobdellovibrionaceae bacterium]
MFLILFVILNLQADDLTKSKQAITEMHKEAKSSQQKINKWDDETKKLLTLYRSTLNKTENLKIYNEQLSSYIKSQKEEVLEIRKKIEEVKDTGKEIVPLMLRMLDSLDQFINLDVPFLLTKRKKRIQELKDILNRSDVSISEKYRQLISAYNLEQDYGRTMESYREIKEIEGKELTLDYLRLGRLVLIYKSLDGNHMSYWDKKSKQWKNLPKSYKKPVTKAIKMAKKQIPPDLVKLPIFPPSSNTEKKL